jgi:tRNA(Phe) wybutosine-synthesizing methylase Tyw3
MFALLIQIVHVLCRDILAATRLLHMATTNGYRESGMSLSSPSTPHEKVLVAIRTTAIRLDIPLASYDTNANILRPLGVSRGYLISLLRLVNEKFSDNEMRKENLLATIRKTFQSERKTTPETKEERRLRKRQEGLKVQAANNQEKRSSADTQDIEYEDTLDDLTSSQPTT